jgi:(p)ppGpp synthase/HD superfamily hydrolase
VIVLSPRYAEAIAYAADAHAHQPRRGTDIPYVAHVIGVSSLVLEAGGDEELAIAALLHDVAEDHGGRHRLADVEERFGPRVARIVEECSDWLGPAGEAKPGWEERKRGHLARLLVAGDDTMLVWIADKVHNSRAIVTDLVAHGPAALRTFHAGPDRIVWYYERNLEMAEGRDLPAALMVPLRLSVAQLRDLAGSAVSGR